MKEDNDNQVQSGLDELDANQVSARYNGRISTRTLANWRTQGKGPKYIRRGGKIFYPVKFLNEWDEKNTYQSTSNYKAS